MRRITDKEIQVHFQCVCGLNIVDKESFPIKWKDFSKAGITRKVDRSTGKPFLLMKQKSEECHCSIDF